MLVSVMAVIFVATFIRSAFGFGEALIAVPLLALIMPIDVAAPVAVLVSITVALVAVAQDWKHVQFRSVGLLFASTCIGIPIGLWLLTTLPEHAVKSALAEGKRHAPRRRRRTGGWKLSRLRPGDSRDAWQRIAPRWKPSSRYAMPSCSMRGFARTGLPVPLAFSRVEYVDVAALPLPGSRPWMSAFAGMSPARGSVVSG